MVGVLNMSPGRKRVFYWNIPIANTTAVMLGMGTSVTQMAMREFARAGVMVGFCGTDGTPLYSANEVDIDVSWLSPQSEYRPTAYLQNWVSFWFDEENVCRQQSIFNLSVYSKLKNNGRGCEYSEIRLFSLIRSRWRLLWSGPERAWKTHRITPR